MLKRVDFAHSTDPLADDDPTAPWMQDQKLGGMTPRSRRMSWLASEKRRQEDEDWDGQHVAGATATSAAQSQERKELIEPLRTVTPAAWRDIPLEEMQWLATNRIPAGEPAILSGDGGGGKTTIALQLAVAVERGLGEWLGTTTSSGPVIFVSAEEPEAEMRRRLDRVARKLRIDPAEIAGLHFHFAEPEASLLAVASSDGTMSPTPLFQALAAAAEIIRPAILMIDSVAAVFGGNQNDRVQVRSFVSLLRGIARRAGCAVLLLDHPSLAGITAGTGRGGSMDWQNSVRARLHLRSIKDDDAERELEVMKINYAAPGEKMPLRWEDGCFVPTSAVPTPATAEAQRSAEKAYLECLDVCTAQGRNVFPVPGRGYAPTVFAGMAEAKSLSRKALEAAQQRLFKANAIENVPHGPPSRGSQRIARKSTGV
jgi:RecA-family ATPase